MMKNSLVLSDTMKTTKDGGVFFREMEEIGDDESKQYCLFLSDSGQEILQRHRMWAGDRTFSSALNILLRATLSEQSPSMASSSPPPSCCCQESARRCTGSASLPLLTLLVTCHM